jgi:regulator of protease activity HflC (stomatin/prohibitin superfamily)
MVNKGKLHDNSFEGKIPRDVPIVVEPIKKQDLQPSYAHELPIPDNGWYGSLINGMGSIFGALGSIPCCFCCPNPYKSIDQGEVGLVTRFGKFYKSADPGLVKVNPLSERLHRMPVRIRVMEIPQQVCMTKDNVNTTLSSVIYYHVTSPHKAFFGVDDVMLALQERTQTTLRLVVGARSLQDIVERREEVASAIEEIIMDTAQSWGVKVESILIKDIVLSMELQNSLSQAAKARRAGESKIITARAEVESAKLMRRAADILASKAAMQIRYLEAMQQMALSSNSKVIFMPSQAAMEQITSMSASGSAPPTGENFAAHGGGAGEQEQRLVDNLAFYEIAEDHTGGGGSGH